MIDISEKYGYTQSQDTRYEWLLPGVLPCEFYDSRHRAVTTQMFTGAHFEPLKEMYDSYYPKGKANGLPPPDDKLRHKWIDFAVDIGTSIIAEVDHRIIGHTILFPMPGKKRRAEFGIFVHQDFQGCAIGSSLTYITLAYAARAGYECLWLIVEPRNRQAIKMYQRAGFDFEGEIDIEATMTMDLEHFFEK